MQQQGMRETNVAAGEQQEGSGWKAGVRAAAAAAHLVQQRNKCGVFLTERLRHASFVTRHKCSACHTRSHLLQFNRVLRPKHNVPRLRLKSEAHSTVTRHGRQLEEIAAGHNLNAAEGLHGVSDSPRKLLRKRKRGGIEHAVGGAGGSTHTTVNSVRKCLGAPTLFHRR